MTSFYFTTFIIALSASFLGTLPFGTVNLNVVETTLRKNFRAGFWMAVAGGIVEILHSFLAVHCSALISENIEGNIWVQLFVISVFLILGFYFYLKKPATKTPKRKFSIKVSDFGRSAFLSLINPQALPFWLFIVTWLSSRHYLEFSAGDYVNTLLAFLLGVSAGKFLALLLFAALSSSIRDRASVLGQTINRALGIIFIFLALVQGIRFFVV